METAKVEATTTTIPALAIEAAAASPTPSPKRRKINTDRTTQQHLEFSSSSLLDQLKSISKETVPAPPAEDRCSSPAASSDGYPASCCSSNGSFELDEERVKFIDPEVQSSQAETSTCNCDEIRRDTSHLCEIGSNSQEVDSMEKSTTAKVKIMPTELELEEFFASAEKDIHKGFLDKYNYDIVKDVPLEGRYEWVQLNPPKKFP